MTIFRRNGKEETPPPLVSVLVLAYNHIDYTRQCIESLYKYTTDVDFELITINNGSTDETEQFFNSLPNEKKISFPENIGVDKAINHGFRIAEGKYTLNLSNDIIVTRNWLSNLVTCMESDEKIAMVVPVCGFSSNYQQVNLKYDSLDEMQILMKTYNTSNPSLWEERMRLVTYTCLFRTDVQRSIGGFDEDFNPGAYDDDAISFTIRRGGYKLMLARDTYVHHFGSVTFSAEYAKNNIAVRNRILFMQKFGIDSWSASLIDFNIVDITDVPEKGPVSILGIGSSCGASILQVKNKLREKGILDVSLDYYSQLPSCMTDLATICRKCVMGFPKDVKQHFSEPYDLIIVEAETDKLENLESFYTDLCSMLKEDGQLITTAANQELYGKIEKILEEKKLKNKKSIKDYYYRFQKSIH